MYGLHSAIGFHWPQWNWCWARSIRYQCSSNSYDGNPFESRPWRRTRLWSFCLITSTNRTPNTINTPYATLVDALCFRTNVLVPPRALKMLQKLVWVSRPQEIPPQMKWFLHCLPFGSCHCSKPPSCLYWQWGTRLHSWPPSHAMLHFHKWLQTYRPKTFTPLPTFIAKNEKADDLIGPLMIHLYLEKGQAHPLCPVHALKDYVAGW